MLTLDRICMRYSELSLSDVMFLILCCKDVSAITSVIMLNSSYFVTVQYEMSAALIFEEL
jgi:hypothetical protein